MICANCKMQTPENGNFCLHCGNPLTHATPEPSPISITWEYEDFVYNFSNGYWVRTNGFNSYSIPGALQYFWQQEQGKILPELQKKIDAGWQSISEIGPAAIKVREWTEKKPNVDFGDIVIWILTFGIVFFFQLISGNLTYSVNFCSPVEFRVHLRRPKS